MAKRKSDANFKPFESFYAGYSQRHIRLTEDMLKSKAWAALNSHERVLYIELKRKYNGRNEQDISFTYTEGQKLMAKNTFTAARDKLIELGFIDIVKQRWNSCEPNIYALSKRWQLYGTGLFEEQARKKRKPELTEDELVI